MTHKQESKYSMKLAVRDFFNKNATITATLPGYGALYALYLANIAQIQLIREQQEIDKSGIKDNKDLLRVDLVTKAYDVGKKTEVYAKMNNNVILAKEVHYSETDLSKAADSKLKDRALLIYDRANANLAALATYGITAAVLTALKNAIDLFNASIPSTRTGKTETKAATDQLAKLFKSDDDLLAKFDLLVEVVRLSQPAFYSAYKDNRKVIDTANGSLALTALITDAINGEGIKGAKATFVLQNGTNKVATAKMEKPLVKITALKGIFKIKSLADGIYIVTIEKTGFKTVTVTVNIANGEMTVLEVKLERN
jgi:hypothetical protein